MGHFLETNLKFSSSRMAYLFCRFSSRRKYIPKVEFKLKQGIVSRWPLLEKMTRLPTIACLKRLTDPVLGGSFMRLAMKGFLVKALRRLSQRDRKLLLPGMSEYKSATDLFSSPVNEPPFPKQKTTIQYDRILWAASSIRGVEIIRRGRCLHAAAAVLFPSVMPTTSRRISEHKPRTGPDRTLHPPTCPKT